MLRYINKMIRSMMLVVCTVCFATTAMAFDATTASAVRTSYASKQVTSSFTNDKIVLDAREDAALFVATDGQVHGAHVEAAFRYFREQDKTLKATDLELAKAILTQ